MTLASSPVRAFRASLLHFLTHPREGKAAYEYFEDGVLIVRDGKVEQVGPATPLLQSLPAEVEVTHFPNCLISPGFIDTHTHFAQTQIIGSPAKDTLRWLEKFTFPAEERFSDFAHAKKIASFFLDELLRQGTTTASVFGTVHPESIEAFFEEAGHRDLRMICGKVLMDRNAPPTLTDTPESAYTDSKRLIEKWQGKHRLEYALTPRFAPTSTPEQLAQVKRLLNDYPTLLLQTHLSETPSEVAWVKSLFPKSRSYLDVYHSYGMCRPRSIFAHAIHLDSQDWSILADTGSSISFCPTSNLFLGSGLFRFSTALDHNISLGLGTDIGGGTSFSVLRTMSEAQKVCALQGQAFDALVGWYLATLGGATALGISDKIGNFSRGKEADFVVLNLAANPLMQLRLAEACSLEEKLFALMTLSETSTVKHTYVLGKEAYSA